MHNLFINFSLLFDLQLHGRAELLHLLGEALVSIHYSSSQCVWSAQLQHTVNQITWLVCILYYKFVKTSLIAGCVMCFAWGLLAPIGILIALFYKVIWPNGEWFYVNDN